MDDGTNKVVEHDPARLREEMRDTRAAITDKLVMLEDRVTEKVENIQHRVEATVDRVKGSVHDTVQTVKDTVNWRHQMNEHPWAMFGGAVLTGFMLSRLMEPGQAKSLLRAGADAVSDRLHGDGSAGRAATNAGEPTLLDKAMGQVNSQVERLERAAISAAGDFVERMLAQAIPGLAGPLNRSTRTGV